MQHLEFAKFRVGHLSCLGRGMISRVDGDGGGGSGGGLGRGQCQPGNSGAVFSLPPSLVFPPPFLVFLILPFWFFLAAALRLLALFVPSVADMKVSCAWPSCLGSLYFPERALPDWPWISFLAIVLYLLVFFCSCLSPHPSPTLIKTWKSAGLPQKCC